MARPSAHAAANASSPSISFVAASTLSYLSCFIRGDKGAPITSRSASAAPPQTRCALRVLLRHRQPDKRLQRVGDAVQISKLSSDRQALLPQRTCLSIVTLRIGQPSQAVERAGDALPV